MKTFKKSRTAIFLMLALALFLQFPAIAAYRDIPSGAWYEGHVDKLTNLGIIDGYPDGGFYPDVYLKRSEFLKMLTISIELYTATPSKGIHWAEEYWNMANEAEVLIGDEQNRTVLFPCTFWALEQNITRYEMAVLVTNAITKVFFEPRVTVDGAANGIKDYNSISTQYKDAVEQAYGKGIITGYQDTSFQGNNNLTRAEASAAMVRLLWGGERKPASFATEQEALPYDPNYESFAIRYRSLSAEQRRIELFGNSSKTYFTSAQDAAGYMVDVTFPVWTVNSSGVKVSSTRTITVHKLVANEVMLIFNEIYNDPERFPIQQIGGARFTDNMRHSWGCAIDINPTQNYYCRVVSGTATALVGTHWRPDTDQFSIKPNGSVVKAFAKYGWGWGGQGWSGGYYDYMHFSILSTGG